MAGGTISIREAEDGQEISGHVTRLALRNRIRNIGVRTLKQWRVRLETTYFCEGYVAILSIRDGILNSWDKHDC